MVEIITLYDADGQTVIDTLDANYEDSFCLDTFGELSRDHQNSEPKGTKSFIIARVQTWDPKQPDKVEAG
jgi:hypothetical protein